MPTLEEVLRAKEAELQQLQKEVDALRLAMRLMAGATGAVTPKPTSRISQVGMAKAILAEASSEMHVKDISAKISERFGTVIKPSYLAPVMYRQIDRVFYKSTEKPNTFGLIEWKKAA